MSLKLFACAKHAKCTPTKAAPGVACCVTCPDFAVPSPPPSLPDSHRFTTRDCLYHVYPLGGEAGQVWRKCLGMLLRRSSLFTGMKVIACMTGPNLESPSLVRGMAGPHGFTVAEIPNDPALRETKTLLECLPLFETRDPHRALLCAHAKGVTRPYDRGSTVHAWANVCHEVCLDYWPLVEEQLRSHPITGPFKKVGRGFKGSASSWHYSGSFAWFRSADLFARDWRRADRQWWGGESYAGLHYKPDEAGILFCEGSVNELDLYSMPRFMTALNEYAWWRAEHESQRTVLEAAS